MRAAAADSLDDPLEQDAPDHLADDPAIPSWFLAEGDLANPATDLRAFTTGNLVSPQVDGRSYFARLCDEIQAAQAGDQVYFLDFRGDLDERLDGPGSEAGEILGLAARRGVLVFGLLWRSQPKLLHQSEAANAEFVRQIDEDGARCCSMPGPAGRAAIIRSWSWCVIPVLLPAMSRSSAVSTLATAAMTTRRTTVIRRR
jgi:phosphatidylserine/phosphatidylglycerophosphate/cardiolipin synthase-like enzyme